MYEKIIGALRRNANDEALAEAMALVALHPADAQAHRWLAIAQQQAGDYKAAIGSIDQAIALLPEDGDLHLARAGVLLSMRRTEDAQSALAQTTGLDPNHFVAYLMQAELALSRGDLEEAARFSRLAARVEPDHPQLAAVDGMLALRRGDVDSAHKLITTALQQLPNDTQLLYALGFTYMQQGHFAFAEQAFRRVVDSVPASENLRGLIAELIHRQGRPGEAADELSLLLSDPKTAPPGYLLKAGQLRLLARQPDQALELLRYALSRQPRDPNTIAAILEAWRVLDAIDDARATLDAALATTTDFHDLWWARIGLEPSDSEAAHVLVNRWLTAMPGHVPALETQMLIHDRSGRPEAAEEIARRIVEIEPGRSSGELRIFDALMARDPLAALVHVEGLIKKAADSATRQVLEGLKGRAQDAAGQYLDAASTWAAVAKERAPNLLPLWQPTAAREDWPALVSLPEGTPPRHLFLFGLPGSGVEAMAAVMSYSTLYFRADRFGRTPPQDGLQSYNTIAALDSGSLKGEALIAGWHQLLESRWVYEGNLIDWLPWWDNALLHAMRPHLPGAVVMFVIRDPRDMLLDWLAFGSAIPLSLQEVPQAAEWLALVLEQIATLHEQQLFPHHLLRADDSVSDTAVAARVLGDALQTQFPPPPVTGPGRFKPGHWRHYVEALAPAFARLTPVAVRLGYSES